MVGEDPGQVAFEKVGERARQHRGKGIPGTENGEHVTSKEPTVAQLERERRRAAAEESGVA